MDAVTLYLVCSSALLLLQAFPFFLVPGLTLLALSSTHEITQIETHLCRSLAVSLFFLAVCVVLQSGVIQNLSSTSSIPMPSQPKAETLAERDNAGGDPSADDTHHQQPSTEPRSAQAALIIVTLYQTAAAILSYIAYAPPTYARFGSGTAADNALFLIGAGLNGSLACFGTWCLLFASGPDVGKSRSSGWLFPSADRLDRKRAKRAEKFSRRQKAR